MTAAEPRTPRRPLRWPDMVYTLQDILIELDAPAYIVGGAVRDAWLHRPISDIDLTTPTDAIGLGRAIAQRLNANFFVLDRERDVARLLVDMPSSPDGPARRMIIDVSRFRGPDLQADLTDRDFTFNAMAADLLGNLSLLIDPLNGERDLSERILRGCSAHSITSDPIRSLRAVRQGIQFRARITPELQHDIRLVGSRLMQTSPERVRDELIKLLDGPTPAAALRIAGTVGLLEYIVPETIALQQHASVWHTTLASIEKLDGILHTISPARTDQSAAIFGYGMIVMALDRFRGALQQHLAHEWPNERPHTALLMLAALVHATGSADTAEHRAESLRLSTAEVRRIGAAVGSYRIVLEQAMWSDLEMHRYWRRLGEAGVDACLLAMGVYLGTAGSALDQDSWIALLDRIVQLLDSYFNRYVEIVAPPPLVDGHTLMQMLNLHSGPAIGAMLDLIREGQVTGSITTVEDALAAARRYLETGRGQ